MASLAKNGGEAKGGRWRLAVWGVAVFMLLLPAVAMQFTSEVDWDETDFIVFGTMLALAVGAYEFVTRLPGGRSYRLGFGLSIVGCFLLVWVNLAVGIIGSEDNGANLMYLAVLAVVIAGPAIGRYTANAMMRTTIAAAVVQVMIAGIALAENMGVDGRNWPRDTLGATVVFAGIWLASAGLFRISDRASR